MQSMNTTPLSAAEVRRRLESGEVVHVVAGADTNALLAALGSSIHVGEEIPPVAHETHPHVAKGVEVDGKDWVVAAREIQGGETLKTSGGRAVSARQSLLGGVLVLEPVYRNDAWREDDDTEDSASSKDPASSNKRFIDSIEVVDATPNEWPTCPVSADVALESPEMLQGIRLASRVLPESVVEAVMRFGETSSKSGALLIRGCPVGDLPMTPDTPTAHTEKDRTSEWTLLSVARLLGHPVGYLPEHGGDLVQNICPTRDGAVRQVSTSSKVTLLYHTEASFHPWRPRWLLLLCLRGDENAKTTLVSVNDILPRLSERSRTVLGARKFRTGIDESYAGGRSSAMSEPHAVIEVSNGVSSIRYDAELTQGLDEEARQALEELNQVLATCEGGVVLQPGDLVIVDNTVAIHGRSPFEPRFDGYDRWLQRAFVIADLKEVAGELDGRIVATRFMP